MNIDFLKCNSHSQTEEYLDMLFTNNLLPIITKPKRLTDHTSTLIDHIYTNSPISQITTGILTVDISDHVPVVGQVVIVACPVRVIKFAFGIPLVARCILCFVILRYFFEVAATVSLF